MTGKEQNGEELFSRIVEMEKLTQRYRDAIKREKDAKRSAGVRFAARCYSKLRRIGRKIGIRKKDHPTGMMKPDVDLALDQKKAEERKELYFGDERIAVYTALFGDYDILREPLLQPDNIDYFVLTDQRIPDGSIWQKADLSKLPAAVRGDSVMSNRWCKMHPHCLFPDYRYSVYIDSNIWVISDLTPVTASLKQFPVAMFRHKHRDCVYDEVKACIRQKKADPESLRAHEKDLRSHGIPEHWGLLEASIIARKHHDLRCIDLMKKWWDAFRKNSRRDQISLIDCLWGSGIDPGQIGTLGANLQRCDLFLQLYHPGTGIKNQPSDLEELLTYLENAQ